MGKNYGSIVDCISACGEEVVGCKFINYAESTDQHCVLYAECSPPMTIKQCDAKKHEWWTTWQHTGADATRSPSDWHAEGSLEGDCWTHGHCICDPGEVIGEITGDQLKQRIRDTVATASFTLALEPSTVVV